MPRASTFTTYLNTEEAPGAQSVLDRYTNSVVQKYGTITRAANEAARAAAGLTSGVGSAGRGISGNATTTRELRSLAEAQRAVTQAVTRGNAAATAGAAAMRQQGVSAARAAEDNRRLATEARAAATANERLAGSLRTTSTILGVVQGPLDPVAGRISALAGAVSQLTGLQGGLAGVGVALFALGRLGNDYTVLQSKLRPFFETQDQANRALGDVVGIAQRARAPLETIADLYGRLSSIGGDVGIDQSRIGRIAEVAAKAATLSGGTTQTRQAGLNQLLQGIGSNNLDGDELRSVKENTFALAQAIAAGFKNADGSIGTTIANLKELGAQGKLTAAAVADALERSSARVEAQYARLPITLSQATTGFTNSVTVFIGRLDEAVQLSSTLALGIKLIGDNLGLLAAGAGGVAAAFGAIKIASLVQGVQSFVAAQRQAADDTQRYGAYWAKLAQEQIQSGQNAKVALEAERLALQQNIDLLRRKAEVARRDALREAPSDAAPGSDRRVTAALRERQEALQGAVRETERLRVVNALLRDTDRQVTTGQQRLAEATANTATRMSVLGRAARTLWAAINPLGLAVGVLVTTLIGLATRTSQAQQTLERAGSTAVDTARRALQLAGANDRLASSYIAVARAAAAKDTREKRDEVVANRREFAGRLSALARAFGTPDIYSKDAKPLDGIAAELRGYAAQIRGGAPDGQVNSDLIRRRVAELSKRYPSRFRGSFLNLTYDTTPQKFDDQITANFVAEQSYQQALRDQSSVNTDASRLGGGGKRKTGSTPASLRTTDIAAEAAAAAIDNGTQSIRAAGTRRTLALKQLDQEFGVTKGQVPADRRTEYLSRRTDIEKQFNQDVAAAKAASAGAAAAKRAQAKQESDAKREALQSAAAKRDEQLAELYDRGLNPQSQEFLDTLRSINSEYDEQLSKISGLKNAGQARAATEEQIAKAASSYARKQGAKRDDILAGYGDEPSPAKRAAKQIADLQASIGTKFNGLAAITKDNPLGKGLYTEEQFQADSRRIEQGLRRPFNEYLRDRQRELEIGQLVLQGRDAEAEALRRAFDLQDQMGALRQGDYERLLAQVQGEQRVNDLLASRERITSSYRGIIDGARQSFETFLVDLPNRGPAAIGDLFRNVQATLLRGWATQVTERVFSGADSRVRALVSGQSTVDQAIAQFTGSLGNVGQSTSSLSTATDRASTSLDRFTKALEGATNAASGDAAFVGTPTGAQADSGLGSRLLADAARDLSAGLKQFPLVGDKVRDVVVTAARSAAAETQRAATRAPNAADVGAATAGTLGTGSKFVAQLGKAVSYDLVGAGKGAFASAIAGAVGIPQDQTGAQIGGGIGGILKSIKPLAKALGPAAAFLEPVLGIAGGLIGSLFQSAPRASTTINNVDQKFTVSGNNADAKAGVSQAARSVQSGLAQIADALNAEIGSFAVSISKYKTSYRVDPTGSGSDGGKYGKNGGVLKFDDNDLQGAIEAAIADAISDGAIKGIRAGTQKLLKSGNDLSRALQKAVSFENVFKDLKTRTDPVAAAVDEVNLKFAKLKTTFEEAGATAQEYADLTKLYELERADAIKQATQNATGAIDQFLKDLVGGSSSPLNKLTTFQNAEAELNKFKADINAGKVVDQNDLLSAARNFQDASRNLNGSSSSFFKDFEDMRALLTKARNNADPTRTDLLAPSPLASDPVVQAKLAELGAGVQKQVDATNTQTQVLYDQLQKVIDILGTGGGGGGGSAIDYLPGFGGIYPNQFR